jgi:hypothetical protein
MTEQSIGEILNGEEPAAETAPVEVAAEAVETPTVEAEPAAQAEGPARGPDGKFISKGEPETAESAPPAPQEETGNIPIAALKDERSKRQTLESEVAQLREQLNRLQQPQPTVQAEPQEAPDQWEDPDGYRDWLIQTARNEAGQAAIQAFNYQRIQTDAAQFRADKPDYEAVIAQFGTMAQSNPGLIEQMQQAASPAKFAYDTAKLELEIRQHGGIDGLIEARLKAREAQAMQGLQAQLPQSAPPTISADRSVGARTGPAWSGPTPLSELLK